MIKLDKPIRLIDGNNDTAIYNVVEVLWSNGRVAVVMVPYGIYKTEVMIQLASGIVYGDEIYRFYKAENYDESETS